MKSLCYLLGHKFSQIDGRKYHCSRCKDDYYGDDKFQYTFWSSDTWYTIKTIGGFILVLALSILVVVFILVAINKASCNAYSEIGIQVQFNFWTGCMANHPKFGWIPVDKYFEVLNLYLPK